MDAVQGVQQGRLAGSVRSDEPQDLAGAELERDAVDRPEAPESLSEVLDGQ
jgi:hypothetical protein